VYRILNYSLKFTTSFKKGQKILKGHLERVKEDLASGKVNDSKAVGK